MKVHEAPQRRTPRLSELANFQVFLSKNAILPSSSPPTRSVEQATKKSDSTTRNIRVIVSKKSRSSITKEGKISRCEMRGTIPTSPEVPVTPYLEGRVSEMGTMEGAGENTNTYSKFTPIRLKPRLRDISRGRGGGGDTNINTLNNMNTLNIGDRYKYRCEETENLEGVMSPHSELKLYGRGVEALVSPGKKERPPGFGDYSREFPHSHENSISIEGGNQSQGERKRNPLLRHRRGMKSAHGPRIHHSIKWATMRGGGIRSIIHNNHALYTPVANINNSSTTNSLGSLPASLLSTLTQPPNLQVQPLTTQHEKLAPKKNWKRSLSTKRGKEVQKDIYQNMVELKRKANALTLSKLTAEERSTGGGNNSNLFPKSNNEQEYSNLVGRRPILIKANSKIINKGLVNRYNTEGNTKTNSNINSKLKTKNDDVTNTSTSNTNKTNTTNINSTNPTNPTNRKTHKREIKLGMRGYIHKAREENIAETGQIKLDMGKIAFPFGSPRSRHYHSAGKHPLPSNKPELQHHQLPPSGNNLNKKYDKHPDETLVKLLGYGGNDNQTSKQTKCPVLLKNEKDFDSKISWKFYVCRYKKHNKYLMKHALPDLKQKME